MSIKIGIGIDKIQTNFIDSDAASFIALAGITDTTQQAAINNIYKDLKGQGVNNSTYDFYSRLTAFWLFVGGTATTNKYNGKSPSSGNTYNLSFSGGWTHDANGSKGNGTNGYADTFLAQNLISSTVNGISVYFRENTPRNEIQMGHLKRPEFYVTEIGMGYTSGANTKFFGGNKFDQSFGANNYTNINGLIRLNRTASNNYKVYRNGIQIESISAIANTITDTTTLLIGAERRSDTNTAQTFSNKTFCYADIMTSNSLSAAEELVYYNIIQAFQTALARQV